MMMKKKVRTIHNPLIKFEYDKKQIGKSTGVRIYRNATLLAPGTWADSITNSPVVYPREILRKYAANWEERYLNIDHSTRVLDRIGTVENPHFEDGRVKADLYIYPVTQNAKDVINLIDKGLVNWLSVEIKTEDIWDVSKNLRRVNWMSFIGCAVVLYPACEEAIINES